MLLVVIFAGLLLYYVNERFKEPRAGVKWHRYGENDVALVTGGSQGLGREIVGQLLYQKVNVIVIDIVEPTFEGCKYYRCDLSNENEVKATIQLIIDNLNSNKQHISLLVNNAGIRHHESLMNLSDKRINQIFNINTFSQIWMIKSIYQNHVNLYKNQRLFIVTISSILGVIGPKNLSVYSASKAATIQIFESLCQEVMLNTIRLLLVTPGQLSTGMFQGIEESSKFFAPIVNHKFLAKKIVNQINQGKVGTILDPFYANFIPVIKCFPFILQQFCRWLSGMDSKIIDPNEPNVQ